MKTFGGPCSVWGVAYSSYEGVCTSEIRGLGVLSCYPKCNENGFYIAGVCACGVALRGVLMPLLGVLLL